MKKKEICFGVCKNRNGYCDVLEDEKDLLMCSGYGMYSDNGILKKCSFYKTNEEFLRDAGS